MTASRWPLLLARLTFAGFLLSVLSGLLLPIYTDEVGWRMQERAGLDGGVDRMLSDICGPSSIVTPPAFMMPFRALSASLNSAFPDPLYVRITGVLFAIAWAFLLWALIARLAADRDRRAALVTLMFALLGMGVLPLMLILSRPDQVILLGLTAALLATLIGASRAPSGDRLFWLWPLLIALLGTAAVSFHLKGILVAPVFLVCLIFAGAGRRSLFARLLAMVLFAAVALQGASYWTGRFKCPGDAIVAAKVAEQNIAASLLGPGNAWQKTLKAAGGANPLAYVMLAEARPYPMSGWLPQERIDQKTAMFRFLFMGLAWYGTLTFAVYCFFKAIFGRKLDQRVDFALMAPLVLVPLVLVWGMSQLQKNDYEAMTVLPMLALFILFSLTLLPWNQRWTSNLTVAAGMIAGVSLIGQVDVARRYLPAFATVATHPAYIDNQPFSAPVYGYNQLRPRILQTARLCGIGANGRAKHPMVDDVTYFAMTDSWQPFHRLGVLSVWNGSITDPVAYLRSRGSEGMIVGCRYLSPELSRIATHNGEFCCISTK